jgi:F0F1-type ATP synthase assembly protein I
MMMIKALVLCALTAVALKAPEGSTSVSVGSKSFAILPASKSMNLADARKACQAVEGKLADLGSGEEIRVVGEKVSGDAAWINSYLGLKSGEVVALFKGGAVAEPLDSDKALLGVVCE